MRVLHVVATPRPAVESGTLAVTASFLDALAALVPELHVERLDLYEDELPAVAGINIDTKYALMLGLRVGPRHQPAWAEIEGLISQFTTADLVLVSAPMWNFSVPYALKYYIDAIVQPGYLFRYDETGIPHGLCQDRRLVFVTSRGGDYSVGGPMHALDFQEPYLRAIFGFCGVQDIFFVHAQSMDLGPDRREAGLRQATSEAVELAARIAATVPAPLRAEDTPVTA